MSAYTQPKSKKSAGSPCGCGGGGSPQDAKCSCSETGCASCGGQAFVRPRFFAGQLLTEDDLQALSDYVVSKNRLHNRYLFGEGVVCGLEVTCHPCGGGSVIVNPGYALDCCGNDLQLACPQPLDINAMVRDLRRNTLAGFDCGDPCADVKKKPEEQKGDRAAAAAAAAAAPAGAAGASETQEPEVVNRHYCLYMRYCEEETDPVSPYATDESCGFQECNASRVREGVRFELRCREEGKPRVDLFSRVLACVGDLVVARKTAVSAMSLMSISRYTKRSVAAREGIDTPSANVDALRHDFEISNERLSLLTKATARADATGAAGAAGAAARKPEAPAAAAAAAAQPDAQTALKDREFEEALHDIRTTASFLAAHQLAAAEAGGGEPAKPANAVGEREIAAAKARLQTAIEVVRPQIEARTNSPVERAFAHAIVSRAEPLAAENPQSAMKPVELSQIQAGNFNTTQLQNERTRLLREIRENLLDRLDAKIMSSDCSLRAELLAVAIPPEGSTDEALYEKAERAILQSFIRYLVDCFCLALNPACQPCDDAGVLLACIEYNPKDCEVVDICNMERTFVLAPASLRYWLPPLGWLGELLEKLCCTEIVLPEPEPQAGQREEQARPMLMQSRRSKENIFESLAATVTDVAAASGARLPRFDAAIITRSAFNVVGRAASSETVRQEFAANPFGRRAAAAFAPRAAEQPAAATTAADAKATAAAIEKQIDARISEALSKERVAATVADALKEGPAREAVDTVLEARLAAEQPAAAAIKTEEIASVADERITAALDKATLTNTARDRELKRLKTENEALTKQLTELVSRVKKLEG